MNISGIYVLTKPDFILQTIHSLEKLHGIDVHHVDHDSGKIIITQEAENIENEESGLKLVQSLPGVITAGLVYHYLDEASGNSFK